MGFLSPDIYSKLFPQADNERAVLQEQARTLWEKFVAGIDKTVGPIQVVCIGYGEGRRELPALLALRHLLDEISQQLNFSVPLIHVHAIEPNWNCAKEPIDGIRIDYYEGTVESWQKQPPAEAENIQWDVVIAFNVLHLLNDWKSSLSFFLDDLKMGGMFLFSDVTGTVNAIDGDFREAPLPGDLWGKTCRKIFEERDKLLLHASKIVAPRSLKFLNDCLDVPGYSICGVVELEERNAKISGEDLKSIIRTAEMGADAATLGALHFYDSDRSRVFVEKAISHVTEAIYSYTFGFRLYSYKKTKSNNEFLTQVSKTAFNYAQFEAIERKATIKRMLIKGADGRKERADAVATMLYDMREFLVLSRDSIIVSTTKQRKEYASSVQMLPISLVGESNKQFANQFLRRFAFYLTAPPEQHVACIFDTHQGDLALQVVIVKDISENSKPIIFETSFSSDGNLCYFVMKVSAHLVLEYRKQLENEFEDFYKSKISDDILDKFIGWSDKDGLKRFYVVGDPASIQESVKAAGINFLSSTETSTLYRSNLRKLISQQFQEQYSHYDGMKEGEQVLFDALVNSLRLVLLDSNNHSNEDLPWKSALYIMRKTMGESGATGVGILLLLSESDFAAWKGSTHETQSKMPQIIGAVEPFLNAIQEIENLELISSLSKSGQKSRFAHQTSAVIDSIAGDIKFLSKNVKDELGGHLLARIHLLRATIASYKSEKSTVDLGEFPFPWISEDECPIKTYCEIGLQLGLARAQDAPTDEPAVREKGAWLNEPTCHPDSTCFTSIMSEIFEPVAETEKSTRHLLKHSSFAVLILIAIKQAVYHTIRSHCAIIPTSDRIRIELFKNNNNVLICNIINPAVKQAEIHRISKDSSELEELANCLNTVGNCIYDVQGPHYVKDIDAWKTTISIL